MPGVPLELPDAPPRALDPLFDVPLEVARVAPEARALIYAARAGAALVAVPLLGLAAAYLWAMPWQADGAVAVAAAAIWCGWLESRDAGR